MSAGGRLDLFRTAARREQGQTMAEYGVVLALITLAVASSLFILASAISGKLGFITNVLSSSV